MFIPDAILAALLAVIGLTLGVMGGLVFFVRRQRQALAQALQQSGQQQLATAQQLANAIEATQRQQRHYEQQLQNLAQATLRLRQDVQTLNKRTVSSNEATAPAPERVLH